MMTNFSSTYNQALQMPTEKKKTVDYILLHNLDLRTETCCPAPWPKHKTLEKGKKKMPTKILVFFTGQKQILDKAKAHNKSKKEAQVASCTF